MIDLLAPFDFEVLLYDPYTEVPGVEAVSLDELCARSTVVSVHAPQLPSTYRMIGAAQLAAMPDGATLINTSRGSLVDEPSLLPHLLTGRLHAILDVTDPELPGRTPLWTLPNVLLTPHVAGSLGNELHRMADQAVGRWSGTCGGGVRGGGAGGGPDAVGLVHGSPSSRSASARTRGRHGDEVQGGGHDIAPRPQVQGERGEPVGPPGIGMDAGEFRVDLGAHGTERVQSGEDRRGPLVLPCRQEVPGGGEQQLRRVRRIHLARVGQCSPRTCRAGRGHG